MVAVAMKTPLYDPYCTPLIVGLQCEVCCISAVKRQIKRILQRSEKQEIPRVFAGDQAAQFAPMRPLGITPAALRHPFYRMRSQLRPLRQ
ncbi:hypothetical protein SDC9_187992 [bioreactor metagenome]|uniref:Uncharacterized protein n=1 Tax=bioreactor metagenome TaxID=1076179 RepID=A0A645HN28_9ZZZZ